jgi:hypothetical protein
MLPLWISPIMLVTTDLVITSSRDSTDTGRIALNAIKVTHPAIALQTAVKQWVWEARFRLDPLTTSWSNPDGETAPGGISEIRSHAGFMPAVGTPKTRVASRTACSGDTMRNKYGGQATAATRDMAMARAADRRGTAGPGRRTTAVAAAPERSRPAHTCRQACRYATPDNRPAWSPAPIRVACNRPGADTGDTAAVPSPSYATGAVWSQRPALTVRKRHPALVNPLA